MIMGDQYKPNYQMYKVIKLQINIAKMIKIFELKPKNTLFYRLNMAHCIPKKRK